MTERLCAPCRATLRLGARLRGPHAGHPHEAEDLAADGFPTCLGARQRGAERQVQHVAVPGLYNLCVDQLRARHMTASEPLEGELAEGLADKTPGNDDAHIEPGSAKPARARHWINGRSGSGRLLFSATTRSDRRPRPPLCSG